MSDKEVYVNRMFKVCFILFILTCLPVVSVGQDHADGLTSAVEIDGTRISTCVPRGMSVVMTPYRLRTSYDLSVLYYRFSMTGKETTYGLHWYVYVTDSTGKIIGRDSWWDRGEWSPSAEVEGKGLFEYKNTPGAKLTIILQEMLSSAGVRSISLRDAELLLSEASPDISKRLPPAVFVKHADLSEDNQKYLTTQTLNTIVEDTRLRRSLGLKEGLVPLLADGANDYSGVSNVDLVSREQIDTHLKRGEPVNYLECCRTTVVGRIVSVSVNHHTPSVRGNAYILKGIRVTFVYRRVRGQFTLQETKTEHF